MVERPDQTVGSKVSGKNFPKYLLRFPWAGCRLCHRFLQCTNPKTVIAEVLKGTTYSPISRDFCLWWCSVVPPPPPFCIFQEQIELWNFRSFCVLIFYCKLSKMYKTHRMLIKSPEKRNSPKLRESVEFYSVI